MIGIQREFKVRQFLPAIFILALVLPAVLTACSNTKEKEIDMVVQTAIPPIDTNAPAKTETATFSLG